jgi:hypothetical protein
MLNGSTPLGRGRVLHCGISIWPMSQLGHSRHFRVSRRRSALAPIADIPLRCRNRRVDHLIRADQEGGRHFKPKGFRGLQDAANAVRQSLPRAGNGVRNGIFTSVAKVTQRRLFGMLVDRLGRTLSRLISLKRPLRDAGPSLGDLIRHDQKVERQLRAQERQRRRLEEDAVVDVDVS